MIPGYNHNIKYQESVYHIQTEDSGLKNPHIITHLFVGGNIVHSRKTSYADIVSDERAEELIVELMQGQHKNMLKDLVSGKLNQRIAERSVNAAHLDGPAPINVDAGQSRVSFGLGAPDEGKPAAPKMPPPPQVPGSEVAPATVASAQASGDENIIEAETLEKAFNSQDDSVVDSIFGEDLISERSLDEVILKYLADDLKDR